MYKVTIRVVETMATEQFYSNFQNVIDFCVENMVNMTGGATVDAASVGYWRDAGGKLIKETGHNIWTLCEPQMLVPLQHLANRMKEYGEQDCVLFIVEKPSTVSFV